MKCSVVIPTRNDSGHLHRCLHALSRQSRLPDQIIVVDNGSTDDIATVLGEFPQVTCFREDILGVAYAVHTGYDAAQHPVILRCDADSIPSPQWVERMMTTMEHCAASTEASQVVAVSGIARFGPRYPVLGRLAGALYSYTYRLVAGLALGHVALWGSNMAMTAAWWHSVRDRVHLSADIHDDYDLSFQLGPNQTIRLDHCNVMLVSWRAAASPSRIVRQLRMAHSTMETNWAIQKPWVRMRDRWSAPRG